MRPQTALIPALKAAVEGFEVLHCNICVHSGAILRILRTSILSSQAV